LPVEFFRASVLKRAGRVEKGVALFTMRYIAPACDP